MGGGGGGGRDDTRIGSGIVAFGRGLGPGVSLQPRLRRVTRWLAVCFAILLSTISRALSGPPCLLCRSYSTPSFLMITELILAIYIHFNSYARTSHGFPKVQILVLLPSPCSALSRTPASSPHPTPFFASVDQTHLARCRTPFSLRTHHLVPLMPPSIITTPILMLGIHTAGMVCAFESRRHSRFSLVPVYIRYVIVLPLSAVSAPAITCLGPCP
ncbi:hypothetical protein FPV67DRAFT_178662 [Lyophyllum atratum]|nr:hypothetical protein FPV67DRAFT_178662 [Lyophyllum atratum]